MDDLDKQKRILNKIIGNKSKVQVYDRATKTSKMIPRSGSSIKSANNSSRTPSGGNSSFAQKQKRNTGGCGSCSRKRKGG